MRVAALSVLISIVSLHAADPALDNWSHWRGPLANGTSLIANPPINWDAKTNIKWTADLPGKGSSSPIVWGDKVFVVTAVETDRLAKVEDMPKPDPRFKVNTNPPTNFQQFIVYCFDRQTGKQIWRHIAAEKVPHEGHHPTHSYAAGSPTTDGKRLYVSFGSFGTYAYDMDGKPLWSRDFGRLNTRLGWGEAVTPVIHGDSLLLNWDQEADSKLICLDPATGKTKWETPRDEKSTWTTPLIVEHKGTMQVILNGTNRVRSYDLATGKQLWACAGMTVNAIPSAIAADGVAFIMSGYKGAMAVAVSLDARGEVGPNNGLIWKYGKGTPYVPSPVLANGRLYFTEANTNLLTVLDAKTGKPLLERERLTGVSSFYASPVAAAGRVYFTDQRGTTLVFKEGDKPELLATNKLHDAIDATSALVGNQVFLRAHGRLYCIEGK
ncbi:MAG TPA: PQQ-binding-like beta-propeller repeat protein [Gemmataceae bacterium]|jgi:outer membrane protein assembly factor BamB|nr:PQQ-binding-like beta-propeller repeat protein [Gemmataceae bacterium]